MTDAQAVGTSRRVLVVEGYAIAKRLVRRLRPAGLDPATAVEDLLLSERQL